MLKNYERNYNSITTFFEGRARHSKEVLPSGPYWLSYFAGTVKLGDKERFDKEQIGVKEPFPVTKCQFTS